MSYSITPGDWCQAEDRIAETFHIPGVSGPGDDHLVETFHPVEADPTGRSPHEPGAKLDAGKVMAGTLGDFALALTAVAEVATFGAKKYTRGGWQTVPNAEQRYTDAMWRHLLKEGYEDLDPDSNLSHAAHLAWNALARLEIMLREGK